jgi:Raf kinase inhibitor-like YbhB/YbcL family protein
MKRLLSIFLIMLPFLHQPANAAPQGENAMKITSSAFENGGLIPKIHTCNGEDKVVPLSWEGIPTGTVSLVMICDDPDAPMGTWDHWIVYNIPATAKGLYDSTLPEGARGGLNSWKKEGYGGPCPPDKEHRYFFKLYALDTALSFPAKPTKSEVLKALEGHVLGQAELMGRYDQPR